MLLNLKMDIAQISLRQFDVYPLYSFSSDAKCWDLFALVYIVIIFCKLSGAYSDYLSEGAELIFMSLKSKIVRKGLTAQFNVY